MHQHTTGVWCVRTSDVRAVCVAPGGIGGTRLAHTWSSVWCAAPRRLACGRCKCARKPIRGAYAPTHDRRVVRAHIRCARGVCGTWGHRGNAPSTHLVLGLVRCTPPIDVREVQVRQKTTMMVRGRYLLCTPSTRQTPPVRIGTRCLPMLILGLFWRLLLVI